MTKHARWLAVEATQAKVVLVDASVPPDGPITIQADLSWPLQSGNRARALSVLHDRLANYVREHKITKVIVKGSAVSKSMRLAHLEAAEVRGAAISAAASVAETIIVTKSNVSKNFGDRKVDDYVKDDDFWNENVSGKDLRVGSRAAAMILLFVR